MKIIAWNVNGLRSLLKTDYLNQLLTDENPDILCIGETKLSCPYFEVENEVKEKFPKYKYRYWSPCKIKQGYSGTAILSKKKPLNVQYGLMYKNKELDDEGRVIVLEFKTYYLLHVYTPNSGQALNRLDWRTTQWDKAFMLYINHLQESKSVIVCGDLNVAATAIDLARPKTNLKTAGFTVEERESFNKILNNCDLIDTFRSLYPEKIKYSFWSNMRKSRINNIGWRIDYFLVSKQLTKKVKVSDILTDVLGSDHAPIKLII